jgi:signal transduction histidine kinase
VSGFGEMNLKRRLLLIPGIIGGLLLCVACCLAWDMRQIFRYADVVGTGVVYEAGGEGLRALLRSASAAGAVVAGAVALLAVLLFLLTERAVSRMLETIRRLNNGADIVARGDLDHEIAVDADDELGRLAASLNRMTTTLRNSNEDLRHFIYSISHDLRSPLVNIKGFSEELARSLREIEPCFQKHLSLLAEAERKNIVPILDKDIPEALLFIGSSVSRMDSLINAILKLSRAGGRKLNPEPVCVSDMVRTILRSLAHQIESGLVCVTVGNLPDVVADSTALEQIFGNLIDNAVKYLQPGRSGVIDIFSEWKKDELVFFIRDNGRGMASEDIPRAFEIFRRLGRQDVPGEGMGLAYVKILVRLHGGNIWCESEPGAGSTFCFTLSGTGRA